MVEHFFYSLAISLKATLHITVNGDNDHHKIEACFKGFAHCLRSALSRSERNLNILPSSKGML
jgi:imidazoleglycerol-phosphate dehydratase/histidinol-phosphatase